MRRGRLTAGALVAVVLAGCGVAPQDEAERVPAAEVPPELRAPAEATPRPRPAALVPVYLVERDRLVREERPAPGRTLEQALRSLLAPAAETRTRRSAVPVGTTVRRLHVRGDLLTVDLSEQFALVRGRDQVLAVAQVVWTATEFPPVRRVHVLVEGRSVDLPVEQGAVSSGPVDRTDYDAVRPG